MKGRDLQTTVLTLHEAGRCKKEIARSLGIDVKTVRTIIRCGDIRTRKPRRDAIVVDEILLETLYRECDGYLERMHEKLQEEQGLAIGYSTLTRMVRQMGLGSSSRNKRSAHVPDIPGEEMQHDTTVYTLRIGGVKRKVICSGIYLRYSKMRYIRFYVRFNRFIMKCFFDEALRFWGYCARFCIIDNTNLAILYGSGSMAVMHPEMITFANKYGFSWKAHEIGHANRKAGKERNFFTVETNFIPGRTFSSLEDMNEQARQWATVRYARRPQSRTKLIPVELFEYEKTTLVKLPEFLPSPYLPLRRRIDEYGYIVVDVNYYWVPKSFVEKKVTVLRYAQHICVMNGTTELVRYALPAEGVRNQRFVPDGVAEHPRGFPKDRKLGCKHEERILREMGPVVNEYIDFLKAPQTPIKHRPAFIRALYALSKKIGRPLFIQTIERVWAYRVDKLDIVNRTAHYFLKTAFSDCSYPSVELHSDYQQRRSYQEGKFSQENNVDYDSQT